MKQYSAVVEFTVVILTVHFKGASDFINKTEKIYCKELFKCVFVLLLAMCRKYTFSRTLNSFFPCTWVGVQCLWGHGYSENGHVVAIDAVLLRSFVVVWFFQLYFTLPTPEYAFSFLTASHKHCLCVKYYICISKLLGFGTQDLKLLSV